VPTSGAMILRALTWPESKLEVVETRSSIAEEARKLCQHWSCPGFVDRLVKSE